MGADRGTHVVTDAPLDSAAVAELLADRLRDGGYDAILTGKQSQDSDAGLAGAMLAERLGLPYVTNAVGLTQEGDALVVTRQGDAGQEVLALPTPCLVTCSNDMNDPRIPNLKGVMAAKKKPVETVPVEAAPATATDALGFQTLPQRAPGQRLTGEPADLARQLAKALHDASVL